MTPVFRLLVFALCACAGFLSARALTSNAPKTLTAPARATPRPAASIPVPSLTAAESPLIAEWEQLRAQHGGDAVDLSSLYLDVKDIKDPFRRRAFRASILSEWATTNPAAALAFLKEKDNGNVNAFIREWLRSDPQAAITGLLAGDEKTRGNLRGVLSEIANAAPGRLAEVVSALPKSDSRWDTTALDAFALFAQKDPEAARAAAESVNGPLRSQALSGVAKAWGEKDGPAALVWAQAMPPGEVRDAVLKSLLTGWAKTDPIAALAKIDMVPPGGEENYFASDVGAQVLREAATRDWDTTVTWLRDHPGKLGAQSLNGMMGVLSHRLSVDPAGTMRSLLQSGVPALSMVLGNAVLNEGYSQHDAIWQWLDQEKPGDFTRGVRSSLLNAMAWKEPDVALTYLDKLTDDSPENHQLIQQGVSSLLNGGSQMDRFEDLLGKISPKLRPMLLESGFMYGFNNMNGPSFDPTQWIPRLNELPADKQANAVGGLARGWASTDPQAAIEWGMKLTDPTQRDQAIGGAINTWANADPYEAAAWLNTLPAGTTRDMATQNIVAALANSEPESAWTWAQSLTTPQSRQNALSMAYASLMRKNPAIARQLLQDSKLTPAESQALQQQFGGATPLR